MKPSRDGGGSRYASIITSRDSLTLAFVESWASASSHVSCWSRDDDSLSFESLSVTSLHDSDGQQQVHSILTDGLQTAQQYTHPTVIRDGNY